MRRGDPPADHGDGRKRRPPSQLITVADHAINPMTVTMADALYRPCSCRDIEEARSAHCHPSDIRSDLLALCHEGVHFAPVPDSCLVGIAETEPRHTLVPAKDGTLASGALLHSWNMARRGFSNTCPDGSSPCQRIANEGFAGLSDCGESNTI